MNLLMAEKVKYSIYCVDLAKIETELWAFFLSKSSVEKNKSCLKTEKWEKQKETAYLSNGKNLTYTVKDVVRNPLR